jgi:tripartite-type tricarboxylate transporter receptor subunit TctC
MLDRRSALAGLVGATLLPRAAAAQQWPQRAVSLVHGFGAGGNADSIARIVAESLGPAVGATMIVEAKPGAGGNLASEAVSKAQADGHTLILLTGGHAVSAALYKSLRFRPVDDFAFVSLIATFPFVIVTRADNPIKSLSDLIEAARRDPGKLTFSSVGYGSTQHLTGELFAASAGIKLTHVPYRGGMQPLTDLLGGQIDLMVDTLTVTGGAIRAGTVRGLGITSATPWESQPEVPPIATVLKDFSVGSWHGIAAPAGTPSDVIERLNAGMRRILGDTKVQERLAALGVKPGATAPDATKAFVASEVARWNRVIDAAGIERL